MTPSDENAAPGAVPPAPQELAGKVERAAGDSGEASELRVEWWSPEGCTASGTSSAASCRAPASCAATSAATWAATRPRTATRNPPRADFEALLRSLDVAALDAASRRRPRIPPDSLVGRLRVNDGRQDVEVTFMADPEQAEAAG